MKVVVIGGTGLIGSKLVNQARGTRPRSRAPRHPTPASTPLTGEGLTEVLTGAAVVVDVSNSPSFEDTAVLEFFETSTRNLLDAEAAAGVGHHVALSVVGTERLPDSGYLPAKVAQEKLIKGSAIPYSIVHATQFFEFVTSIADEATVDGARCAFRTCCSSRWPRKMSLPRLQVAPARRSTPRSRSAGPNRSVSTDSIRKAWPCVNDRARSWPTRTLATSGPS